MKESLLAFFYFLNLKHGDTEFTEKNSVSSVSSVSSVFKFSLLNMPATLFWGKERFASSRLRVEFPGYSHGAAA